MKRRFEYVGGSSAKYWTVQTEGCNVIVRFGRIGTPGQNANQNLAGTDRGRTPRRQTSRPETGQGLR